MSLHAIGWQIVGTSVTAIIGVIASYGIAAKNRRQLVQHGAATLDVQRVANARSAAPFIADKRQKWIDDLRADVSLFVALTVEMTEGWKRLFDKLGTQWDNNPPYHQDHLDEYSDDVRVFAQSISDRNSEHTQLLTRILLRLNNEEVAHNGLVAGLFKIRSFLDEIHTTALVHRFANQHIYRSIEHELQFSQVYAKVILKEEWQKLKREMADPERLIREILATSAPDEAAVDAFVQKTAPTVPTHFSPDTSPWTSANLNRAVESGTPPSAPL